MGIFGSKKTEEVKGDKVVKAGAKTAAKTSPKVAAKTGATGMVNHNNRVIVRPRITEKSTLMADTKNVFVFEIAQDATKQTVSKAVASIYGVIPVKVSIARTPSKKIFARGKSGVSSGVKKAYVYLKAGDKIEIV